MQVTEQDSLKVKSKEKQSVENEFQYEQLYD